MSIVWPPALPQRMVAGSLRETEGDNVVRSQMSVGPAKVRRRGTAGVAQYSGDYSMTSTQRAAFKTFFKSTIAWGATSFTWPGPDGTESLTARIAAPPAYANTGPDRWRVSLSIEVLP